MTDNKKLLWKHIVLFCLIVIAAGFGCPIYEVCGICCPLCGTTRAWVCFMTGETARAFRYHPLFLVTPFWFFVAVHYDSIFQKNKAIGAFLMCVTFFLVILNILRMMEVLPWLVYIQWLLNVAGRSQKCMNPNKKERREPCASVVFLSKVIESYHHRIPYIT